MKTRHNFTVGRAMSVACVLLVLVGMASLLFYLRGASPGNTHDAAETRSAHALQDSGGAMAAVVASSTRSPVPTDVPASSPRALPAREQLDQEAQPPTSERAESRRPTTTGGLDQPTIMTDHQGWTIIAGKVTPMGTNQAALAGGMGLALSNGAWITGGEGAAAYSNGILDRVAIRGEAELRATQDTNAARATMENVEVEGLADGSVRLKADRLILHSPAKPETDTKKGATP